MTLLEKIKNYKWFDSPNKLKPILEELYNSIGGGSGGGTQDLQSVLDNGGLATKDGGYSGIELFGGESGNRFFSFYTTDPNEKPFTELTIENNEVNITNNNHLLGSGYSAELNLRKGVFTLKQISGEYNSSSLFGFAPPLYEGSVELLLPSKPSGNYTLATLDDIKKIDLSDRVYADNAAAISGGLTTNDVYRTSTGELRIVV